MFFKDPKESLGILIAVSSAFVFGLYPPAARVVYQEGGNVTFVILTTTFFRLAGLYAFVFVKRKGVFQNFQDYKTSLYAGAFQALSIAGILGGSFLMPGAVVISIVFTYTLMLLLFSAWKGTMRLNRVNVSATILSIFGLSMVLNAWGGTESYPVLGITLAFMAALSTFARTYIFEKQSRSRHPIVTGAETFTIAFLILLSFLFWRTPEIPHSLLGVVMILVASASLTVGSFGMFYGISRLGAYKFGMIVKLEPIFTTLFGILLSGDTLTPWQYAGIGLVVSSLIALQAFDRQKS